MLRSKILQNISSRCNVDKTKIMTNNIKRLFACPAPDISFCKLECHPEPSHLPQWCDCQTFLYTQQRNAQFYHKESTSLVALAWRSPGKSVQSFPVKVNIEAVTNRCAIISFVCASVAVVIQAIICKPLVKWRSEPHG